MRDKIGTSGKWREAMLKGKSPLDFVLNSRNKYPPWEYFVLKTSYNPADNLEFSEF